jgi:cysteine desulfurase
MIYLDWAATAPPDSATLKLVAETAKRFYGNPSSIHSMGREANRQLESARKDLSLSVGCSPEEIFFTSGGTESNNLVITSALSFQKSRTSGTAEIVISGIEHDSVYSPARYLAEWGIIARIIETSENGLVDPKRIEKALNPSTRLVSLMYVSNESGAIQPLADVVEIVKSHSKRIGRPVLVHTDAVQACGKIPLHLSELGVEAASLSAHKLRGPRGVGALYLRKGASVAPLYRGGGQEAGIRPGTENLPGIMGFSHAARMSVEHIDSNSSRAEALMSHLIGELRGIAGVKSIPAARMAGVGAASYSPYILKITVPPIPGEVLVRVMGEQGIVFSTGSACSSRKKDRNRVLANMGISPRDASSAVRISIGPTTSENELDRLIEVMKKEIPKLLKIAL